MDRSPSICQGNNTCDARQAHVCYNGTNAAYLAERPWDSIDPEPRSEGAGG